MSLTLSRRSFLAGSTVLAAGAAGLPTRARAQSTPVRIGLLTVKTGPLAAGGIQMEQGTQLFWSHSSTCRPHSRIPRKPVIDRMHQRELSRGVESSDRTHQLECRIGSIYRHDHPHTLLLSQAPLFVKVDGACTTLLKRLDFARTRRMTRRAWTVMAR
jgi:hypothetical protein